MVRNDSLARIVMLLCFGTAILSLTLHWQMNSSMPNAVKNSGGVGKTESEGFFARQIRRFILVEKNVKKSASALPSSKKQAVSSRKAPTKPLNRTPDKKVLVDLSDRRVYVYRQNTVIASYPIGVGKKGWETPTGTFEVMHKQQYPAWQHPITGKVFAAGPNSPLGERWIGFWSDGHNEIGFHGTPDSELVGSPVSHGCLRMRNPDVRLFYEQVGLGIPVQVRK